MRHCNNCFALNPEQSEHCRKCGLPIVESGLEARSEPGNLMTLSEDSRPAEAVCSELQGGSRGQVSRSLMYLLGIVLLALVPLLLTLEWRGAEAQPQQTLPSKDERYLDIRKSDVHNAAKELRRQLDTLEYFLESHAAMSPEQQEATLAQWQRSVEDIKARYRIWGVVDVQHPDAVVEDALRNAVLYLHSLKHVALNDPGGRLSPEYQRLRGNFLENLATAVR